MKFLITFFLICTLSMAQCPFPGLTPCTTLGNYGPSPSGTFDPLGAPIPVPPYFPSTALSSTLISNNVDPLIQPGTIYAGVTGPLAYPQVQVGVGYCNAASIAVLNVAASIKFRIFVDERAINNVLGTTPNVLGNCTYVFLSLGPGTTPVPTMFGLFNGVLPVLEFGLPGFTGVWSEMFDVNNDGVPDTVSSIGPGTSPAWRTAELYWENFRPVGSPQLYPFLPLVGTTVNTQTLTYVWIPAIGGYFAYFSREQLALIQ